MIRLSILNGHRPGASCLGRRFPLVIGRGERSDLVLEDPGVWERHATLELDSAGCFRVRAEAGALVVVNGVAQSEAELRNGDVLELGAARVRFGMAETQQRSQRLREWAIWMGVALLCLGQLVLIHWVLP